LSVVTIDFEEEGTIVVVPVVEQCTQNKPSHVTKKITTFEKTLSQLKTGSSHAILFDNCHMKLTEFKIED